MKTFEELGIIIPKDRTGQIKTLCPKCSSKRKKKDDACLSVNIDVGLFNCHNCGFAGSVNSKSSVRETSKTMSYSKPKYNKDEWAINKECIEYFRSRGISKSTLENNFIGSAFGSFTKNSPEELIISFPFIKNGEIVNVKYRTVDKKFRLSKNGQRIFFGIQNLFEDGYLATNKLFITEGEIDSLTLYECGYKYALSVPNGANIEEEGSKKITPKFSFLDDEDLEQVFTEISEVILVTDSDYKGVRLREELSNRIGADKCYYVEYPADCKDINDVLVKYGSDKVIECINSAKPILKGILKVEDLEESVLQFYKEGLQEGKKCGIESLDNLYTLQEGLITLVTGTPESYKSVLLDNMTLGYAMENNIHVALFSPETKPIELHIGRLASMFTGKSLDEDNDLFMDYDEFKSACNYINDHFTFLKPTTNSIDEILALTKVSILKYGTKILVIDPYSRLQIDEEVEMYFIQSMLNKLAEFAEKYKIHIFIVAHPVKMDSYSGKGQDKHNSIKNYPIVTPYHIKGSATWFNNADFILSLWRDRIHKTNTLRVYCLKSKYYHIAKSNEYCELDYNFDTWKLI